MDGRRIRVLHDGPAPAGNVTLSWDGRDESGRAQPSGSYLVIARSGSARASSVVCLVK